MMEQFRTRLAVWVVTQPCVSKEARLEALEVIKAFTDDRLQEVALQLFEKGLETMTDLSWLRG